MKKWLILNACLTMSLTSMAQNSNETSNQRINKLKVFVKQEHDLGKDWNLNYGANYTTTRDHSSQAFVSGNQSQSNSAQTEDQASVYVGASKDFGEKLSMEDTSRFGR